MKRYWIILDALYYSPDERELKLDTDPAPSVFFNRDIAEEVLLNIQTKRPDREYMLYECVGYARECPSPYPDGKNFYKLQETT